MKKNTYKLTNPYVNSRTKITEKDTLGQVDLVEKFLHSDVRKMNVAEKFLHSDVRKKNVAEKFVHSNVRKMNDI